MNFTDSELTIPTSSPFRVSILSLINSPASFIAELA